MSMSKSYLKGKGALTRLQNMSLEDRFWSLVTILDKSLCWLWQGSRYSNPKANYGRIKFGHKNYKAHRLSWVINRGEIPEGLLVCHTCDNPPCVNPDHLFLGTPLQNMQDKVNKGRLRNVREKVTHCPRGHEYNYKNTRLTNKGRRVCKECQRVYHKDYWKRRTKLVSEVETIG